MSYEPRFSRVPSDGDRPHAHEFVPLDQLLATAAYDPASLDPTQVRATILAEHRTIRAQLARLEADATALLACSTPKPNRRHALRQLALQLCGELRAHFAFENQVLVPVLEHLDAWGPVRAQQLLAEHAQQRELLRAYKRMLRDEDSSQALASAVWQLVETIRQDMREEEASVLSPELLSDDDRESVETG